MTRLFKDQSKLLIMIKIIVLAFIVSVCFYVPSVKSFLKTGISYLYNHDYEGLKTFILSFGIKAPITSITLMTLQSLVPFVPGIIITVTNAWIFGWQYGAIYSFIGAFLGAILDFGIARWYGRPVVEKFISSKFLDMTDNFFEYHGAIAVCVTRIIPIIPFKVVSYGAGLTSMTLLAFGIATAIGQTPAILLYSIMVDNLILDKYMIILATTLLTLTGITMFYYRDTIEKYLDLDKNKL